MPLLFSYGTLQREDVQLATLGRLLAGRRDELPGFEESLVPIHDPAVAAAFGKTDHVNAVFNGKDGSRVSGSVFEITNDELAAVDGYEHSAGYQRITVMLASGARAWAYVFVPL